MTLLSMENVSKRYRRGRREFVALRNVSFAVDAGEVVVVLGTGKSGRSTLLRLAAGFERPDEGIVRLGGRDIAMSTDAVGRQVAYCRSTFSPMEGERVIEHVSAGLLAQGMACVSATRRAERVLELAGVAHCAHMEPYELDGAECVRVGIARALSVDPKLLVIDDPTSGVGALQADPLLRLLRSIADEGIAVLMCTDDATCISGADRALSLDDGKLRGEMQPVVQGDVVQLRALPGTNVA
jgi:putative ABC transport system ATP-binding protein